MTTATSDDNDQAAALFRALEATIKEQASKAPNGQLDINVIMGVLLSFALQLADQAGADEEYLIAGIRKFAAELKGQEIPA